MRIRRLIYFFTIHLLFLTVQYVYILYVWMCMCCRTHILCATWLVISPTQLRWTKPSPPNSKYRAWDCSYLDLGIKKKKKKRTHTEMFPSPSIRGTSICFLRGPEANQRSSQTLTASQLEIDHFNLLLNTTPPSLQAAKIRDAGNPLPLPLPLSLILEGVRYYLISIWAQDAFEFIISA